MQQDSQSERLIFANEAFRLTPAGVFQDGAEARVLSPRHIRSTWRRSLGAAHGTATDHFLRKPSGAYPRYSGSIPVLEAAYNLALCELEDDTMDGGLLMAGKAWPRVWTRDVAYAAHLSLALAAPERAMQSLRARVRGGEVVEDTGTGGSWPVSTDRVAWALGAWSLCLDTGDRDWLPWCCAVLRRTLLRDEELIFRPDGLPRGESSFLDWREQSYPDWMTPADIGASCALGTSALHAQARHILARMLLALGEKEEAGLWLAKAERMKKTISRRFRLPESGRYGAFLHGRFYETLAPRTDALAESLCVLFNIADGRQAQDIVARMPRSPYGTPVYSPFKSGVPQPYHNRAVWPFVEAYALWAAGTAGNLGAVSLGMASLLRAALLFGTNKENFSITHRGDCFGTALNSDRQLWSVAGMLSLFYHNIFGLQWSDGSLIFSPAIPREYGGDHWITGLRLRGFTLDLHVHGYGMEICGCLVNGREAPPVIPADSTGHFLVELELNPMEGTESETAPLPGVQFDLPEPRWLPDEAELAWEEVEGSEFYVIYRNGLPFTQVTGTRYRPARALCADWYQIQAVSQEGRESFPGEPRVYCPPDARLELSPATIGENGGEYSVEAGQAWLDTQPHTRCLLYATARIAAAGDYLAELQYSNATESRRDGDTCALRDLFVDGAFHSTILLPHNTERGRWEDFSWTSPVAVHLDAGAHRFALRFTARDRNANGRVNQCLVRTLRLTRIASRPSPPYEALSEGK
ncbi:MAG: hypothetical protein LIO63_00200 [Akkermansia sp.]|nr:hypothetical protein [Akkermansia sp.]